MVEECRHLAFSAAVIILRHHVGDEVHFLAALIARIADGVEDQFAVRDFVDFVLMQELIEIETEWRLAERFRKRLKRKMRVDEVLRLHRHLGAFGVRFIAGGVRSR
jgi:hypothetical protein